MEKLKLEETNQYPGEFLCRDQLKKVMGGTVPSSGGDCHGMSFCPGGWLCSNGQNSGRGNCDEASQWCLNMGVAGVTCP